MSRSLLATLALLAALAAAPASLTPEAGAGHQTGRRRKAPPLTREALAKDPRAGAGSLTHYAHPLLRAALFSQLNGAPHVATLERELEAAVAATAGPLTVVEVGSGLLVTALAARHARVQGYVLGNERLYKALAKETARRSGLERRVRVGLPKGKIDVLILDAVGAPADALREGVILLRMLRRKRRLAAVHAVVPASVSLWGVAVHGDELADRRRVRSPLAGGVALDLTSINGKYAETSMPYAELERAELVEKALWGWRLSQLCAPLLLHTFDFRDGSIDADVEAKVLEAPVNFDTAFPTAWALYSAPSTVEDAAERQAGIARAHFVSAPAREPTRNRLGYIEAAAEEPALELGDKLSLNFSWSTALGGTVSAAERALLAAEGEGLWDATHRFEMLNDGARNGAYRDAIAEMLPLA